MSIPQQIKNPQAFTGGFLICKESDACPELVEGMTYFGSDITSLKPI
jgi:hypothetical protein